MPRPTRGSHTPRYAIGDVKGFLTLGLEHLGSARAILGGEELSEGGQSP